MQCNVGYDETINPSITNDFATAGMRFGHSIIQSLFNRRDANYNVIQSIPLSAVKYFSFFGCFSILCQ